MAFDLATAKPAGGFDLSTAKPIGEVQAPTQQAIPGVIDRDPMVGMGEATLALGSGMVGAALGGLSGLAGTVMPGPEGQGADRVQRIIDALRYEPRTTSGRAITGAVAKPFEMYSQHVADPLAGAATDLAAKRLPPEGAGEVGAAVKTGMEALPMLLGRVIPKAAGAMAPKPNPALDAIRGSGLKVVPEEAKAGLITRQLAGASDEGKLARGISQENNPILVEKLVKDFKLPKGTELDVPTLNSVIKEAYKPYEKIRTLGDIRTDAKYTAEADAIASQYKSATRSFPKMEKLLKDDVEKIADGIDVRSFNASDAVDMVKALREKASESFAKGENSLGFAHKRAANAIDDMIERHAHKSGSPEVVKELRDARATIAQANIAKKALGPQGTINPQVYARELKKERPLTGGAREVAEFARDFPRSAAKPSTSPSSGPGAMDLLYAAATKEGLLPFVRPAVRGVLSSGPYQSAFVRNPGSLAQALASPTAQQALPAAGLTGTTGNRTLADMIREASR